MAGPSTTITPACWTTKASAPPASIAAKATKMVERRNRLAEGKLEQEMLRLGSLRPAPVPEYVNYQSRARKWSTIQVS